ncbi:MAG: cobalamin biosynthesis protein [Actinobacteria bacterium]|nr:cobalamin biosynthesis protein [Actinomycetota bacterium]
MRIAVIAVTERGAGLGVRVALILRESGHDAQVFTVPGAAFEMDGAARLQGPLGREMGGLFKHYRGLVMIMALGIVVRTIAPHIGDKRSDPAVVAMDERGTHVISVLSGHTGGANDLARLIARHTGAGAVITTATDVMGAPAVDVLARDFKLQPEPAGSVKKINGALARGEKLYWYSEYHLPLEESAYLVPRPWETLGGESSGWRAVVTGRNDVAAEDGDILLRPRNLVAGVGCKKGAASSAILREVKKALAEAGRSLLCLKALATIDKKSSEEGIIEAAEELKVPLLVFNSEDINKAIEDLGLQKSEFVTGKMGVGGVCEPAAMLACRKGILLAGKIKGPGVTVALAEEKSGWWE